SLVESAKDPTFTLSEIAEHGYAQDCRGLQDYPYCSARSRTRTPPSRPTTRSDTTRLHRPLIHPTRKPPPTTALPRQFSQNTRQRTRTATRNIYPMARPETNQAPLRITPNQKPFANE